MDKYRKLASDTFLFAISSFASKILIFILLPLYTGILSTSEYGTVDLLTNIVNLIYPLLTLSIVESTLRFAFDQDVKKNEILSVSLTFIFLSTLFLFIFTPMSYIFGETINKYWIEFILLFLGTSLQNCFSFYCRGINKIKLFATQGVLQTIITVTLNLILLLVFNMGIMGYLISTISAYYITVIYIIIKGEFWKEICGFKLNKSLMYDMLKYSIPLVPSGISWWISSSADKYFIIGILGLGASGIYSVAHKIPSMFSVITDIFNKAWQISAIGTIEDKNSDVFYSDIYRYFTLLCIGTCSILMLLAEALGKVLFLNEYFIAWTYVPPLLISTLFSSLSGFLASVFISVKKTKMIFYSTLIGAFINIILNYSFIKTFGIMGASYSTMVSFIVVWIIRLFSSKKIMNIKVKFFKTSISMTLLIIEGLIMCNEIKLKYFISIILILLIILTNMDDIKVVCKKTLTVVMNKLRIINSKVL